VTARFLLENHKIFQELGVVTKFLVSVMNYDVIISFIYIVLLDVFTNSKD